MSPNRPATADFVLSFDEAVLGYGKKPVLSVRSFDLHPGQRVLIRGDNGCGKSTAFRALLGEANILAGSLTLFGRPARPTPNPKQFVSHIGYMTQASGLFDGLSVREHLVLAQAFRENGQEGWKNKLIRGLGKKMEVGRDVAGLSGGERRWLSLTMTLLAYSRLLLLDEPLAGLSSSWASEATDLVAAYLEFCGASCLIIEHRTDEFRSLNCIERTIVMADDDVAHLV